MLADKELLEDKDEGQDGSPDENSDLGKEFFEEEEEVKKQHRFISQ